MPTVEVVRDLRSLAALQLPWNRLLAESAADTVFLTWEWVLAWWGMKGGAGEEPFVLAVRDGDRLVGIAPLRLRTRRLAGALPLRILEFAPREVSDCSDVVAAAGREPEVCAALADFLAGEARGAWDVWRLTEVPEESPTWRSLPAGLGDRGLPCRHQPGSVRPYASLADGWEAYLATRSTKFLKRVRWERRHAHRSFAVELRCVTEREDLHRHLDRLLELQARQWGGRSAIADDPRFRAFHARFFDLAAAEGWPRMYALHFDSRLVGVQYWLEHSSILSYYQSGQDPDYDRWSVGTLLLHEVIEAGAATGVREVDLLRGDEAYKSNWATGVRCNCDVVVWGCILVGALARVFDGLRRRLTRRRRREEEGSDPVAR